MAESIAIALYALGLLSLWGELDKDERKARPILTLAVAALWPTVIAGALILHLRDRARKALTSAKR